MKHAAWLMLLHMLWNVTSFAASEQYNLTRLSIWDSTGMLIPVGATDLNDKGQIVANGTVNNRGRTYLWQCDRFTDIGDFMEGEGSVQGFGINNRTQIVGSASTPDGTWHGFIWSRGEMLDIGSRPNDQLVDARAINDRGQVVGTAYTFDEDESHYSFIWRAGHFTELPLGSVNAINNNAVVTGITLGALNGGFLWWRGRVFELGTLPETERSVPSGINDRGDVVGYAVSPNRTLAFSWRHGRMTELPLLSLDQQSSLALDTNDRRQVVGSTWQGQATRPKATLWQHSVAYALNELVHDDDPLKNQTDLLTAFVINNRGQILSAGRDTSGAFPAGTTFYFLLTPHGRKASIGC